MNQIAKLQKAITFLTINECHEFDLTLEMNYSNEPKVTTDPSRITHRECLQLKRAFGVLEPSPDYGYAHKDLRGRREFEGVEIHFELTSALTCEKYDPDDITDDKWEQIKERAKQGEISIPNCRPTPYKIERKLEDDSVLDFYDESKIALPEKSAEG